MDKTVVDSIKKSIAKTEKCVAWISSESNNIIRSYLIPQNYRSQDNVFTLDIEDAVSKLYFEEMITGSGKINLYFTETGLILECELVELKEDTVRLKPGAKHRFINRRRDMRINPDNLAAIVYEDSKRGIHRPLHDLSMGGCSIVIMKGEAFSTPEGALMELGFKVGSKELKLKATVVKKINLKPFMHKNCAYGGKRISFQFLETNEKYLKVLARIIEFYSEIAGKTINS